MAWAAPPKPAAVELLKGLNAEGLAVACGCPVPNGLDVVFAPTPANGAPGAGGNKPDVVFEGGAVEFEKVPPGGNNGVVVDPFGFNRFMAGALPCAPKVEGAGVVFKALGAEPEDAAPKTLLKPPAWACCCCAAPNPPNGLFVFAAGCVLGAPTEAVVD